jgi:hypothetical protein
MKYTTIYAHLEPQDRIRCETQATDSQPEGYPVLGLGPIAVFPTVEQLRRIRAAIDGWLSDQAARESAWGGPTPTSEPASDRTAPRPPSARPVGPADTGGGSPETTRSAHDASHRHDS